MIVFLLLIPLDVLLLMGLYYALPYLFLVALGLSAIALLFFVVWWAVTSAMASSQ